VSLLDSWETGSHTEGELTFPTYRKGSGPGVIVIHEIPGPTPKVIDFAEEVVAAGFTVVMPHLFGRPEEPMTAVSVARTFVNICVRAEFTKLATGVTAPIATWLRSLARDLHDELGGPGVGALGMCFTGGFALAMMVDESVAAPVLCQPSTPFAVPEIGKALTPHLLLIGLGLALLLPVIPFGLEMYALRRLTTAAFGTLMCLEPALALLAGLVLLGQVPGLSALAGVALVVAAGLGAVRTGARQDETHVRIESERVGVPAIYTGGAMSEEMTPQENPAKDPEDWVTGDEPMTGPQRSYLQTLAREAGRDVDLDALSKADASRLIDELQVVSGRGTGTASRAS